MPPLIGLSVGVLWLLAYTFKEELKKGIVSGVKWVIQQIKEPTKPLLTPDEHAAQAERTMRLHQYTQRICDTLSCDHATVYASMNGEYLKNRESVEKLLMISEAVPLAMQSEPRYMQTKRMIYTHDIPAVWLQCCRQDYVLLQQGEAPDEFANRTMRQRGYQSSLLTLIITPLPTGERLVLGVLSLAWKGLPIRAKGDPHAAQGAHITDQMEDYLHRFRVELADLMDGKPLTSA
jgi:hypothetical protein